MVSVRFRTIRIGGVSSRDATASDGSGTVRSLANGSREVPLPTQHSSGHCRCRELPSAVQDFRTRPAESYRDVPGVRLDSNGVAPSGLASEKARSY